MKINIKGAYQIYQINGKLDGWQFEIFPFCNLFHNRGDDGEPIVFCFGFGWLFWSCSIWIWPKGVLGESNTR
jgi:hypothetical protein